MATFSTTRDNLTTQVCFLIGDGWFGTATGGTNATIVDTSRLEHDDFFNSIEAEVYVRSGTYAGQRRLSTDFVGGATPTLTFSPVLAGAIVAGVTYSLHSKFMRAEVVEAINKAIDMVVPAYLYQWSDETTLDFAANTYEYDVPNGFAFVHRLTMADADGYFGTQDPIPNQSWGIVLDSFSNVPAIRFERFPADQQYSGHYYTGLWADDSLVDGRSLKVEGLKMQSRLLTDASICYMNPAYVAYQAAALLLSARPQYGNPTFLQQRADVERERLVHTQLPIGSKRVGE